MTGGAQQQLDAAIAAEAWEDAAALQEELSAAAQQAAALAASHGFHAPDAADLTDLLGPPAPAPPPAAASISGSAPAEVSATGVTSRADGEGLNGSQSAAPAAASTSTSSTAEVPAEGSIVSVPPSVEDGKCTDGRSSAAAAIGRSEEEQSEAEPAAEARGEPESEAIEVLPLAVTPSEAAGPQHAAHQAVALDDDALRREVLPPSPSTVQMEDGYVSGSESSTSDTEQPLSASPGALSHPFCDKARTLRTIC